MNAKVVGLSIVLAGFVGVNIYALEAHGYIGLFEAAVATPASTAVLIDLIIALSLLVFCWLAPDARDRGTSPVPYVVLTVLFGSIGPLVYLIRRASSEMGWGSERGLAARNG